MWKKDSNSETVFESLHEGFRCWLGDGAQCWRCCGVHSIDLQEWGRPSIQLFWHQNTIIYNLFISITKPCSYLALFASNFTVICTCFHYLFSNSTKYSHFYIEFSSIQSKLLLVFYHWNIHLEIHLTTPLTYLYI